jgi:parvulin-like peptidyl-prolyl isomerase
VLLPPAEAPAPPAAAPAPVPTAPQAELEKKDPEVLRAGAERTSAPSETTLRTELKTPKIEEATRIAAKIGDDVITSSELRQALKERKRKQFANTRITGSDALILASYTLSDMIDRTLILQEAKRKLKDPKKYQLVIDAADRVFRENEVPALMRKYKVPDEKALKEALVEDGQTLEQLRQNFRHRFVVGGYVEQKLGAKFRVDLPEKRAYYNEHLHDFDRAAQVTWREVVIEVSKSRNRIEARRRADEVLARLRRGENFAQVASTASDGPNKALGGRWQTTPGGYSDPAVNRALEGLPIGQVSPIIEGPNSFHVVLVEERRDAGPARYDEVQEEVEEAVYQQKVQLVTDEFIEKLRKQADIRTMFDGTQYDPAVLRASALRAKGQSK